MREKHYIAMTKFGGKHCGLTKTTSCSYCAGRGKKLVTWYSEGDWGETSYTSYECTSCNGRGRSSTHTTCSSCGGDGFKFSFENQ